MVENKINWNTVLVVLVIGVVGILLLSNSGILTGAFSKDITGAWGSGSGTDGRIAKWSGTSSLTNSVITELNSNIGIGPINPTTDKLSVKGVISSQVVGSKAYTDIVTYANTGTESLDRIAVIRSLVSPKKKLELWTPNGGDIALIPGPGGNVVIPGGNVGIGTIAPGNVRLAVNGRLVVTTSGIGKSVFQGGVNIFDETLHINPGAKLEVFGDLMVFNLNKGSYRGRSLCIGDIDNTVCICGYCSKP